MGFFRSLFSARPTLRHYARIDQQGICRALKHCSQAPAGSEWVPVKEPQMSWLGQPLPASARIAPRASRLMAHPLLAA